MKKSNTCFACGLNDPDVEAGGIYHCPNPLCTGCGATYWKRENLSSFRELDSRNCECDHEEWLCLALLAINQMTYERGKKIMDLTSTKKLLKKNQWLL